MTELEQYINAHFEIIQSNELTEVGMLFNQITSKKGDYFLNEGKLCDKFCFMCKRKQDTAKNKISQKSNRRIKLTDYQ